MSSVAFSAIFLMAFIIGCGSGVVRSASDALQVSPSVINFGAVNIGDKGRTSVAISNAGQDAVSIAQLSVSGQTFSVSGSDTLPINIPPSGTYQFAVGFAPVASINYSGKITMLDASSKAIAQLQMQGTGSNGGILTVSTTNMTFGNVTVNTPATQSLTLTSSGTSPVTINSATITGTGFAIVAQSFPVTLNPAQSLTLQVQFSPTTIGAARGQLIINSDSSTGSPALVALSGTGTAAPAPQLTVSVAALNFGNLTVNTSATQSVTLTSTGTSPVTVNSAAITGAGFSIVAQSLPMTLNPSQSVTLQVQFSPAATGTAIGQLTVSSNSSTGSSALVALSGTGTAAPAPQLTVSVAALNFGNLTVNTSATQSLILTSTGTSPVTVKSVVIMGAGFSIVAQSLPVTLNPSQSMTLQVQFSPAAPGAASGQLTISSNSSTGSSAVVALSGTGTATAHEVDLTWNAPTDSPDPVVGYNIYRATGSGPFVVINPSPDLAVAYVDSNVVSGTSYTYEVTSVDSGSKESVPSNQITVTIP